MKAWRLAAKRLNWREELIHADDKAFCSALRASTWMGRTLETDRSIARVEVLLGRRLRPLPAGRPRKTKKTGSDEKIRWPSRMTCSDHRSRVSMPLFRIGLVIVFLLIVTYWIHRLIVVPRTTATTTISIESPADRGFLEIHDCRELMDGLHTIDRKSRTGASWYCDPNPGLDLTFVDTGACSVETDENARVAILIVLKRQHIKEFDDWCTPRIGKLIGVSVDSVLFAVEPLENRLNGRFVIWDVGDHKRATELLEEIRRRAARLSRN